MNTIEGLSRDNRVLPIGIIEKYENGELSREYWEPSEYKLAKFLDENLPSEWAIFTKPEFKKGWGSSLTRLTPDIVIAHPQNGIMIFEVKEWNINSYKPFKEITKKGKWKISVKIHGEDKRKLVKNPVDQAKGYFEFMRDNIYEILAEIDEKKIKNKLLWYGVYMCSKEDSKWSQKDAEKFLGFHHYTYPHKCKIITDELIEKKEGIKEIIPLLINKSEIISSSDWATKFKDWISPPLHTSDRQDVITEQSLDKQQRQYIEPKSNSIQKLCGVCGSGKTVVIAMRAAKLASLNKKVLIVYFNITLKNHIKELIKRTPYKRENNYIKIAHFHEFLHEYMDACRNGFADEDDAYEDAFADEEDAFTSEEDAMEKCIEKHNTKEKKLTSTFDSSFINNFDAILIDEGQDFKQFWFDFLKCFLSKNEEILIAFDGKQNVYNREKIKGIGSGRWPVLKQGYRLLNDHIKFINNFSREFLKTEFDDPETPLIEIHNENQHTLPFTPEPYLNVYYTIDSSETQKKLKVILDDLVNNKKHKISDTAVLVSTHEEGLEIKKFIAASEFNIEIKTSDIFREDKTEERQAKILFKVGGNTLKLCTIKSFKGWERRNIIMIISERKSKTGKISYTSTKEIYTALSRVREKLFIIDQNSRYKKFFSTYVKATL
jgi:hypothetical protein